LLYAIAHWNAVADWGVRIEQIGGPASGGIKIIETRPGGYEAAKTAAWGRRGERFADMFLFLAWTGESERVHPQMFEAQARRHWEERLRQRVAGKDFADLADARDRAISLEDNQRKERARDIHRRAENLDAHLEANGIDAFVPANWPKRDGVTPIENPHEARNEIVIGKDGKKTALLVESAVQ